MASRTPPGLPAAGSAQEADSCLFGIILKRIFGIKMASRTPPGLPAAGSAEETDVLRFGMS